MSWRRLFGAAALLLFGGGGTASGQTLQVELEVQDVVGDLGAAELSAIFVDGGLRVIANYAPERLVVGRTARRDRVMPFGSRTTAILRESELQGSAIVRKPMGLAFDLSGQPPDGEDYRLSGFTMRLPLPKRPGYPHTAVFDQAAIPGKRESQQSAFVIEAGPLLLRGRLRLRWGDAQPGWVPKKPDVSDCLAGYSADGPDHYLFAPVSRFRGYEAHLAEIGQREFQFESGEAYARALPAGVALSRMAPPLPARFAGLELGTNRRLTLVTGGHRVEQVSIVAHDPATASSFECENRRSYSVLFADGRPVSARRELRGIDCTPEGVGTASELEISWLDNGSVARYWEQLLTLKNGREVVQGRHYWNSFVACRPQGALPEARVKAFLDELMQLRSSFSNP